jgi:decaprenylphospho-beta-D-erythro-pentofuranosid-2-ulose 2-reductase
MRKKILIIGGSSDIGAAIASRFAEEQFDVWLAGRDADYLSRVAGDIAIRKNAEVNCSAFDASDFASHSEFYAALPMRPDVSVCVFGYLGEQRVAEDHWDESKKIIDCNYTGAVSVLNMIAEDYARKRKGTIIGISSVAGDRGRQSNYIYGSAKAGFTAYLSGLRNRLYRSGVHVLTVKPGFVNSKMTDSLTLPPLLTVSPEQVASSVFRAYRKKQNVVYVSSWWRLIMAIITAIPETIFKRLKL